MDAWSEALRELRGEYVAGARAKLEETRRLLAHLASDPSDRPAQDELMRRFHGFAGSGTTYGFPGVSEAGLEAEREIHGTLLAGTALSPASLEQLRTLLKRVTLDLEADAPTARVLQTERPKPEPRAREILVVDDDPAVIELVSRLLAQEGMLARAALTKGQAERELETRLPDGMIVDILLPDGSGYELVSYARGLPKGDELAIVILSVRTGFLDKVESIHCGADGFFEKPLDWERLIRRLQHLLDRNRTDAARILSVEDDPSQSAFFSAVLESAGYEVRICADPRRFDSELSSFRPDLVLMDILLPGVTGYDLVRFLRQDERYATLPVIFLTTEGQVEAQIETLRAGADDHLIKPVLPGLLLSAVAGRLERARFLKSLLNRDGLTRLLTHTAFLERARTLVARKQRNEKKAVAWVMLDLDAFKDVNDRHGHPCGDGVLTNMASLLRRRLRQSDTVGRYGGEEFAILLEELSQDEAMRLVSRLLEEFRATSFTAPDESTFHVSFSAGIAMLRPGMNLESWRQAADDALYGAKAGGRNQVRAAGQSG